ncbi:MAG: hypothetical protein R3B90_02320 [Planctomycetaceae bacterium]
MSRFLLVSALLIASINTLADAASLPAEAMQAWQRYQHQVPITSCIRRATETSWAEPDFVEATRHYESTVVCTESGFGSRQYTRRADGTLDNRLAGFTNSRYKFDLYSEVESGLTPGSTGWRLTNLEVFPVQGLPDTLPVSVDVTIHAGIYIISANSLIGVFQDPTTVVQSVTRRRDESDRDLFDITFTRQPVANTLSVTGGTVSLDPKRSWVLVNAAITYSGGEEHGTARVENVYTDATFPQILQRVSTLEAFDPDEKTTYRELEEIAYEWFEPDDATRQLVYLSGHGIPEPSNLPILSGRDYFWFFVGSAIVGLLALYYLFRRRSRPDTTRAE